MTTTYLILTAILAVNLSNLILPCDGKASNNQEKSKLKVLNEETWTDLLNGEWMVKFYAPWCGACKSLAPEWAKLADWSEDLSINVGSVDVTENPGLSGRFMVSGLPTIYHVKNGIFRIYNGPRNSKSMINFVDEKGWQSLEPVSRWLRPDSLQMSFIAYSFKISMLLRDLHNYFVEKIGLPYYISYLIFALCTVSIGTILGLIIVFIIDQLCPPRYPTDPTQNLPRRASQKRGSNKKEDTKLNESDLEDSETKSDTKSGESGGLVRRKRN